MKLIDADELKSKKEYSAERCEWVVPVAAIDRINAIDAVPVAHGRWINVTWFCSVGCEFESRKKCSVCGYTLLQHERRGIVCPHCSAIMDGVSKKSALLL